MAQGDSLYLAGPAATRDLSNWLTAAHFDTDLKSIDVFSQAPSFDQADTDEMRLKKLQDLRHFTVSLGHKILRLSSASWVHFESIAPLADRITICAEKLTKFGLVDGAEYNINEMQGEIQTLTAASEEIDEQYKAIRVTVNSHVDAHNVLDPLASMSKVLKNLQVTLNTSRECMIKGQGWIELMIGKQIFWKWWMKYKGQSG